MAAPIHKIRDIARRYPFRIGLVIATLGFVAGCAGDGRQTYLDPLAYCSAVRTIDHPDRSYVGPASPEWIEVSLAKQLGLSMNPDAGSLSPVTWRCAEGQVVACSVGMGMPCDSKPTGSRVPSRAVIRFCRAFVDIDRPLPNLGPELSMYQWGCRHGQPHLLAHQPDLDAEGYLARYWFRIPPEAALSVSNDHPIIIQR